MKMLITVVSSLLVGLSLASSNFSPIQELQHFLINKRRIFYSAGVAVTGYFLILAGLVISLVEGALQLDAQGFLMWSSLFTVAAGLAICGFFAALVAKLMIPPRLEVHETIFHELNKQFGFGEGLEALLRSFADKRDAERAAPASEPAPERRPDTSVQHEERFAEPKRATEPLFHEMPSADVLHH